MASSAQTPRGVASLLGLHGFTGLPSSFQAVWDHVGPGLSGLRVSAPALTGHGPEPHLGGRTFEDEVARIGALASALPAPRLLLGYSMGARLALGLLCRQPDLFQGALLIGPSPGLTDAGERKLRAAQEQDWRQRLGTSGLAAFLEHFEDLPVFASQADLTPQLLSAQRQIRTSHTAPGLAHALRVLGLATMPDYLPELSRVPTRVQVLTGERDRRFSELARTLAAHLPAGQAEVVPGAGHNLLLEAPAAVAEALLLLIKETTSHK